MSGWGNELGMVLAEAVVRAGTGREEGPGLQEDYRKNRGRIERHPGLARRADGKLVFWPEGRMGGPTTAAGSVG